MAIEIRTGLCAAIAALTLFSTLARAQDEFDPRQAIKEIKKDMDALREDFSRLQGEGDAATADRVVENIDKLLEGMQASQSRVMENIDQLIKNQKQQQSSSSSSQGQKKPQQGKSDPKDGQQQKNPQHRDNNEKPEEQKRDQPKDQPGEKPEEQPSGQDAKDQPSQGEGASKQPESGREKVPVIESAEVWGRLPPEVRQLLIERNYRDYFPNYEKEIADYLKSLNKKR